MCVTPASYIKFSYNKKGLSKKVKKYWTLRRHKYRLSSEKEYQQELRNLITDAVHRRLNVVSGPIGAELSGGLDSGVIDILINRAGREGIYYSWTLDPSELKMAERDERYVIGDICEQEHISCNYSHKSSSYEESVAEVMSQSGIRVPDSGSNDFRFVFPADTNTYDLLHGDLFVAEHGSCVMFTGHGGDEGVSHRGNPYEMFHFHEYYHFLRHMWSTTHGQKNRSIKTIRNTHLRLLKTVYA